MGVLWTMLGVNFERRFVSLSIDFELLVAAVWLLVAVRGFLGGVNDAIVSVDT
jgi:hypothetical protein